MIVFRSSPRKREPRAKEARAEIAQLHVLYLAGNALFKRISAPYVPLSRLIGLAPLAVLVPFAISMTTLVLAAAAAAVLIIVALWEWRSLGAGKT